MLKALLLDLDNTLLFNDMADFLPRYIPALSQHAAEILPPEHDLKPHKVIVEAVQSTIKNTDPSETNLEVFWRVMNEVSGIDWLELGAEPHFTAYYEDAYHQLEEVTEPNPAARPLIEWALAQGIKVVIATNPLYPRVAIEGRIRWAGIDDLPFALVTWADNMHATKPHQAYYVQILEMIEVDPADALMVGDDWRNDIEPTAALGMPNHWVPVKGEEIPDPEIVSSVGTLAELYQKLLEGWLRTS